MNAQRIGRVSQDSAWVSEAKRLLERQVAARTPWERYEADAAMKRHLLQWSASRLIADGKLAAAGGER